MRIFTCVSLPFSSGANLHGVQADLLNSIFRPSAVISIVVPDQFQTMLQRKSGQFPIRSVRYVDGAEV